MGGPSDVQSILAFKSGVSEIKIKGAPSMGCYGLSSPSTTRPARPSSHAMALVILPDG